MAIAESAYPRWLIAALRTDHAGESGAVEIYRGVLAVTRDPDLIAFATHHMRTEAGHLNEISALLPARDRSILTPAWRGLGWLTGAIPSMFGSNAVFATIEIVETFVDHHYQAQIDRLRSEHGDPAIIDLLDRLRRDEVGHRDDAAARRTHTASLPLKIWTWLVRAGSAVAVQVARVV
jgi:ubiquinone biosynthesis monooxygenase Coq7